MTIEEIAEINPDALTCDGFDDAIIGIAERINLGPVVAYDVDKILEILISKMDITEDDLDDDEKAMGITLENKKYEMAVEYFEYNIKGAWMGEFTPVFITKSLE